MTTGEKLNLIVQLSIPSVLAQVTTVLMFYIDASMVGSLGAEASASIGLVEPARGSSVRWWQPEVWAFPYRQPTSSVPTTLRRLVP